MQTIENFVCSLSDTAKNAPRYQCHFEFFCFTRAS